MSCKNQKESIHFKAPDEARHIPIVDKFMHGCFPASHRFLHPTIFFFFFCCMLCIVDVQYWLFLSFFLFKKKFKHSCECQFLFEIVSFLLVHHQTKYWHQRMFTSLALECQEGTIEGKWMSTCWCATSTITGTEIPADEVDRDPVPDATFSPIDSKCQSLCYSITCEGKVTAAAVSTTVISRTEVDGSEFNPMTTSASVFQCQVT